MIKRQYKQYTKEFKLEAIRLAEESDRPVTQVARELGLRVNQLYKWRTPLEAKQNGAFMGKCSAKDKGTEIRRLKKALAASQEENEFLKKGGVLCEEPAMRYAVIHRHHNQHSVRMMCRATGVSRSGYYDWVGRLVSRRTQRHQKLTEKIRYFHQVRRGSPRIREELLESGERVRENTVAIACG